MRVGYAYWGYLADAKFDNRGNKITSPDGNAFYSWSIINSLMKKNYEVYQMMPNRDKAMEKIGNRTFGYSTYFKSMGFNKFYTSNNPRYTSYVNMKKDMYNEIEDWSKIEEKDLFDIWDRSRIYKLNYILLEWRMPVAGRNTDDARGNGIDWQPDLFIQETLIKYCSKYGIKLIIFDLDYKLTKDMVYEKIINKGIRYCIIELGHKWEKVSNINGRHIDIPFDFDYINNYDILDVSECHTNLIYVGNRYERDWCIDKYIPTEMNGVYIYGKWVDADKRWSNINFRDRINVEEMYDVYSKSVCTILLAKKEYVENGFMTARVIESIFYGTLPLFIEEFGNDIIRKYASIYCSDLTVRNKADVIEKVMYYKHNPELRKAIINYLRSHLKFMDSDKFVSDLEGILKI